MSKNTDKENTPFFEKFMPVLLVATVILAFMVGILWQKVVNLEKNPTDTENVGAEQESPISVDNLKIMAKDLGLDKKKFNSCLDDGEKAQKVATDLSYGESIGVTGTPAFFINGRFLGGAYPFASFKEVIDKELAGLGSNNYLSYSKDLQAAYDQGSFIAVAKDINIEGSYVLGDPNATVTLVEFSDFECPFCSRHFSQTWPEIKKEYVDTGKVKVVFKHFPLDFHANAQKASEAAECAGDQGKFWEMHELIFVSSGAS